jgi:hypothetical protein
LIKEGERTYLEVIAGEWDENGAVFGSSSSTFEVVLKR